MTLFQDVGAGSSQTSRMGKDHETALALYTVFHNFAFGSVGFSFSFIMLNIDTLEGGKRSVI